MSDLQEMREWAEKRRIICQTNPGFSVGIERYVTLLKLLDELKERREHPGQELKCPTCHGAGVVHVMGGRCIHTGEQVDDETKPCPACLPREKAFVRKVANAKHYGSTEAGHIEFNALVKEARGLVKEQ